MAAPGLISATMTGIVLAFRLTFKGIQSAKKSGAFQRMMLSSEKRYKLSGFEAKMTKKEAGLILNVPATNDKDKVRKAHRTMMNLNHPDRGGSIYIASKINEAKDALLKERE
eukprot:TRINITY_DN859_c0_g1_i1.p1 TRINITY_DN859_c0_g1~~TRINITY_DN859_c0_g1_i1.p1  ORF type:complete len:112 (-),score=34.15 TRINITY_DN859_c0_g1_i1:21-356(-)